MVCLREITLKCEETGCDRLASVEVVEECRLFGRYCIEHGKERLKELQIKKQNENDEAKNIEMENMLITLIAILIVLLFGLTVVALIYTIFPHTKI